MAKVTIVGDKSPQQYLEVHMPTYDRVDWYGSFETDDSTKASCSSLDGKFDSASDPIQQSLESCTLSGNSTLDRLYQTDSEVATNDLPLNESSPSACKLSELNDTQIGVQFVLS